MASEAFDAVVIGAGPGGYVAALRLAQLGKKTALVEKEDLGGASLNWGCIPSKALIAAANLVEDLRGAAARGLSGEAQCSEDCIREIDVRKLRDFKAGVVQSLVNGIGMLEKGNGVDVIRGTARLVSAGAIDVVTSRGTTRIEAPAFVLATGARPLGVPGVGFDGEDVWSAREALALREIPRRLLVIGGGVIGTELGTAYAKLGSRVTLVEALPSILPGIDPEAVRLVEKGLRDRKVAVHVAARAKGLSRSGRELRVVVEEDGAEHVLSCDKVLVAAGFTPNTEGLGLQAAGVKIGRAGFIEVDDRMQTNVPGIYCVGDLSGPPLLAHKASKEGEIAAEVIAGKKSARDWVAMPRAVFSDPEIASVGLSEEEARAQGYDPILGKFAFGALGRALAIHRAEGFVKVVADRGSRLLLGVTIAGPAASDLIAQATLALEMGAYLEDVALTIHAHPTLPEAFMEACKVALGEGIRSLTPGRPARPEPSHAEVTA